MEEVLHKLCSSLAYTGCNFDCNSMANILHIIYKSYSLFQLKISQSYTYICVYMSWGTSMLAVKLADQTAELHTPQTYSQSQLK